MWSEQALKRHLIFQDGDRWQSFAVMIINTWEKLKCVQFYPASLISTPFFNMFHLICQQLIDDATTGCLWITQKVIGKTSKILACLGLTRPSQNFPVPVFRPYHFEIPKPGKSWCGDAGKNRVFCFVTWQNIFQTFLRHFKENPDFSARSPACNFDS